MEKVESFYKEYEDLFEEYLDNVRKNLKNNNEKYIELQKEYHKILDDECFALSKLVKIHYDIHSIEEKEIFFLGGKEAYFFFKKLGILA